MNRLSIEEVRHVALLSRLRLTNAEVQRLAEDLNVILQQFEVLQQIDTSETPPTTHPYPQQNVLREDIQRPSLPREAFLSEAPEARDEFFVVPRVVET
jgi:aspartyl-tRNA(Asn)/glutamyl-tRNA(Gln) amidotransferase subunit C